MAPVAVGSGGEGVVAEDAPASLDRAGPVDAVGWDPAGAAADAPSKADSERVLPVVAELFAHTVIRRITHLDHLAGSGSDTLGARAIRALES